MRKRIRPKERKKFSALIHGKLSFPINTQFHKMKRKRFNLCWLYLSCFCSRQKQFPETGKKTSFFLDICKRKFPRLWFNSAFFQQICAWIYNLKCTDWNVKIGKKTFFPSIFFADWEKMSRQNEKRLKIDFSIPRIPHSDSTEARDQQKSWRSK